MDPLGSLVAWAAPLGFAGLFAAAASERLIPVMPSYGLLVAVGIGAGDCLWSVPLALSAVTSGGVAGSLATDGLAAALGEVRSLALLRRGAHLAGLPAARLDRWVQGYHRHQGAIAFAAQLVPTIRLLAPLIAGLLGHGFRTFLLATTAGVVVWSAFFIGLGYLAAQLSVEINASVLALQLLLILLAAEGAALLLSWRLRRRRPQQPVMTSPEDRIP
ncbi:DedA family protein [Teichococcus vastitatis]|uniref:DedA family protein n=1 Tax=Teichococcus vastitatis TaxID=2307076 RepID=UPI000E707CF7|nr:VTT domain-containing protein [Pseudoroseomonas vastitatis]